MLRILALICTIAACAVLAFGLLRPAPAVVVAEAPLATAQSSPSAEPTLAPPTATTALAANATPSAVAHRRSIHPPQPTTQPLSARFQAQPGDRVTLVAPGVFHLRRISADPLRINVLLFDLQKPGFRVGVALNEGGLTGRQRTSNLAVQYAALAAVNGDLFSDNGLPQGLTIIDGRVVTAPKHRATFAWRASGEPFIGYFTDEWTWQAEVRAGPAVHPLTLLNTPCPQGQICMFNDFSASVPAREGDIKVLLDNMGTVIDVLAGQRVKISPGRRVLQGSGAGATWLREHATLGERLDITIGTDPALSDFSYAISGGPIILRNGEFVADCLCALRDCSATARPSARLLCEDFSTDWKIKHYDWVRMPRTGIGFDAARQTLIVAVADGYQPGYSRGITQAEFAALLREFGAYSAMELDGGGSATMWLDGRVVNRPPPEYGERYVANALLFYRDPPLPAPRATNRK